MKNNTRLGKLKNSTSYFYKDYGMRAQIFTNGTLRIDKTQESDSGNYTVELFDQDGICIRKEAQHLEIEEGVLGSSALFHLKNKTHGTEIKWNKGGAVVASLIKGNPRYFGYYKNRAEIFENGTLRLHKIQENDLGIYTVNVTDKDGNNAYTEYAELLISMLLTPVPQQEDEMPDHQSPPEDRVCTTATELSTFTY
ncbi:UNVERIFIED_CONTAM: hypothetical protein FKN15_029548 [Acipenser sinensis]